MGQSGGRGDRTRAALVAAAVELFGRKGVEATAVDEITAAAAVAKGTFYVHFRHKPDVLLELGAQLVEVIGENQPEVPARAALGAFGDRLAVLLSQPSRPLMGRMVREIIGNRDEWLRVLGDRPTLARLVQPTVERGQAEGALRTDQSPVRLAQALTILWLDAVIGWAERDHERPLGEDLALATAMFLDGAAVRR